MKLAFALSILLYATGFCIGQPKIDSLKTRFENVKKQGYKEDMASYLSLIGNEFLATAQYDSALVYCHQAVAISAGYPQTAAATLNSIGVVYNYKGYPDSSIRYYNKALEIYRQLQDTSRTIITALNLSIIYKDLGLYENALESAFDALTIQEKRKPDRSLASIYSTMATVYAKTSDYFNALLYHRKALAVRREIKYSKGVGQSLNNIGETYINMKQYDSALTNLMRSVQIKREAGDRSALATSLNLIGEVYLEQRELKQAEPFFMEALQNKKETGERAQQAIVLNNLGKLKLADLNYSQSEKYLDEAAVLIQQAGLLDDLRKNLELKIELYKAKPDYHKAINSAQQLLIVKDSLLNKEKAQSLMAMQIRYETEKKEQQIILLQNNKLLQEAELKSGKTWIQALALVLGISALLGLLIYNQYRIIKSNKLKVELLLKELNHRVKNNLQILSSLFSLQSQSVTDESAIQMLRSSESRVNAMAIIHKRLYQNEASQTIDMKNYLSELLQYLAYSYNYADRQGELDLLCEQVTLDVDKAIPLGLIINELASNAMKYAFTDQVKPRLVVQLHQNERQLEIKISDNGSGLPGSIEALSVKSFGLKLVTALIKELKGTLKTKNHNGATFQLTLPNT